MLAIVADSTAMLTRAEAAELGVTLVNNTYVLDGAPREESFMDENGDYDAALRAGRITDTHAATVAAFRSAAEAGANVIAFEKAEKPSVRSMQYCYINGSHYEELGMEPVDEDLIINEE